MCCQWQIINDEFLENLRWNSFEFIKNSQCRDIQIHIIDKLILKSSKSWIEEWQSWNISWTMSQFHDRGTEKLATIMDVQIEP